LGHAKIQNPESSTQNPVVVGRFQFRFF
jgi:hypothetical protein